MAIADIRREYRMSGLDAKDLGADPIVEFQRWFNHATEAQTGTRWRKIGIALYKLWHALLGHSSADVNAMTLATVDSSGQPSTRTVLLKGVDKRGFVFFTNYDSRKGNEIAANPRAALTFFWPELERQVCVAGVVEKISRDESETYFKSRPRGSQIGAWASHQSQPVKNRAALEKIWQDIAAKFPNEIPIPPNWGGFVLSPRRIEFWQGRPSRLHDRFSYTKQQDGSWELERLSP